MNFKAEFPTLIINGFWNEMIFSEDWVLKYLLPNELVEVSYPINFNGSYRFSTTDFSFHSFNNRFFFDVKNKSEKVFSLIQELANKVADYLPHTPVSSFGVNFIFESDKINHSDMFNFPDNNNFKEHSLDLQNSIIKRSFKNNEYLLNFGLTFKESMFVLDFNYHFTIKDLVEFKQKIDANPINKLKDDAIILLKTLYNINFD